MKLGIFSLSLSVKDLTASKEFYEKLGFKKFAGDENYKYLIMKNGETVIGLFQDMFKGNILTFNPGWNSNAAVFENYDDIRIIQNKLIESGIEIEDRIDAKGTGPANFSIKDPDGNIILFDQHI
ncbi:MAG: VOC family protein [Candidatus Delongbacteria bacterium]|nr:VOC family protein [Candidatus Delongbacteria bacterium]MBN2835086.1 VOC family protein [Candidatus Delongbacteria bacterium]